ncbi:MAG: hypothetical protein HOU81_22340 [Hamadaea sp.]|uniref:hypothetical protein n=1 Tax=Hamadaea sp. TaxID=2024425 RepID=UPI001847E04A|nr:hypothetical protein [Hamadaea sp.]NUR73568.1 hypothetical protein [Hamadaea sp.]NUT21620.1 hypothetical protein [Hamadaea sp.]
MPKMPSKKTYIAAGVIAAGSAAAVTAYAVRRKRSRDKAVDAELAVMIDEVEAELSDSPQAGDAAKQAAATAKDASAKAKSSVSDLLGAKPAFDA